MPESTRKFRLPPSPAKKTNSNKKRREPAYVDRSHPFYRTDHSDLITTEYNHDAAQADANHFLTMWEGGELLQIGDMHVARFGPPYSYRYYRLLYGPSISDAGCHFIPALHNGKLWALWPDEGHGGIAHIYHNEQKAHTVICHVNCVQLSESIEERQTQVQALRGLGLSDSMLEKIGGKKINGYMFKSDADPTNMGNCARCGQTAPWIAGAAEYLCHEHQDEY